MALSIQWRLSMILKTYVKSVGNNVFWYVKVCVFWKYIQYTSHWDKTQMLKKFSSDKIDGTKNALYFFCKFQLITVFLLIYDYYMSWSARFVSPKLCVGFSIFDFVFVFSKVYIFVQQKTSDSFTLKRHNSFQN